MSELLEAARAAVAMARSAGAQEAAATASRSREVEVGWRDGAVEKVVEATSRSLSVSLYVDGRYSAVNTSDLRPDALRAFVGESIAMARTLAPDTHRSLPDPKLYEGRAQLDLRLDDPSQEGLSPGERRRLARELEEAARSAPGSDTIVSVTTNVSDSRYEGARVASNGFEGERRQTSFWLSASTTVKDPDGRRPDGHDRAGARFFAELPGPAGLGQKATARAVETIGARKIPSAILPMIVENRVASRLIGALLGPLSGRSLQQKQSYLDGHLGKSVGSKLLTLIDEPHLPKGFGSRLWDAEGIAARRRPLVESGVLRSYLVDVYYGRKLGVAPTSGSTSNLVLTPGKTSADALLRSVKEGFLVTSFLGGNSNALTGDYSFGVQGFRVAKGARAEPIAEMNISGNQKDLWARLAAVGDDPYPYSATLVPSLLFESVQLAGA